MEGEKGEMVEMVEMGANGVQVEEEEMGEHVVIHCWDVFPE